MKTNNCLTPGDLHKVLQGSDDLETPTAWEHHLEECSACRSRLEALAGEPEWWSETEAQLSSRQGDTWWLNSRGDRTPGSDEQLRGAAGMDPFSLQGSHPSAGEFPEGENRGVGSSQSRDPRAREGMSPAVPAAENRAAPARDLHDRTWDARGDGGTPPLDSRHPEFWGRIGRYDIERIVGRGGFGVVYKGYDTELNRPVAIKVLAPHLATNGVARRRFAREAQAAAGINHPNVIPIHAVDAAAEMPYLVMTFISGHSLQSLVSKYGPLDYKSIVRIGQQIAAGLAAAHRQGLVHRDIKPANILLENDLSRAVLTDFGLARAADDAAATQTGWLAGTPHYMSPEQASGRDIDQRSDLFSLGSVLYFLATGREPFRGDSPLAVLRKISETKPLAVNRVNSDIPPALAAIIERLLEKDPRDRFPTAESLAQWFEEYLAYLQQPAHHQAPKLSWNRTQRQRWVRRATVTLATIGCGVAIVGGLKWRGVAIPSSIPPTVTASEDSPPTLATASNWQEFWSGVRTENEWQSELNDLRQAFQKAEQAGPAKHSVLGTPAPDSWQRQRIELQELIQAHERAWPN